jgi:glycosyltransferase involved in cell wall biosynthesis
MTHAIRNADKVITISETSKEAILERFDDIPDSRIVVAPNGLDPYFLEPADAARDAARVHDLLGNGAPYVLCVGQASPRKNHYRAIEAFLEAFADDAPMRMVLVRRLKRPDARMKALLRRPEVKRRVTTLDYVDQPSLRALYRRARIFFFPSYVEGFGLPLLEAMASGCPVVTADRSALREVAGDAALLCSPFNVSEMAAALRRLDHEDALRQNLIERGKARLEQYTYARCAAVTFEVYKELAGQSHS